MTADTDLRVVERDSCVDTGGRAAESCLYPPLQPHAQGWLEVGDGHRVHWEECGNPNGTPALFVHGGPGAGCTADDRRWFDPQCYRIVLVDQRGAGRSQPAARLVANSTAHLVRDMEALRLHLKIDRWLLFGGAWGAALALAYAERHPARVRALVLYGVFTATRREQDWLYGVRSAAATAPVARPALTASPRAVAPASLLDDLTAQLHGDDPHKRAQAARSWAQWEADLAFLESPTLPQAGPSADAADTGTNEAADAALTQARIGVHFASHGFFMAEGELLVNALRLRAVPGVIVQGARDLVTPPAAALDLHREWLGSVLRFVEGTGHDTHQAALARQLVAATDSFAAPTRPHRRRASDAAAHVDEPCAPRWRQSC